MDGNTETADSAENFEGWSTKINVRMVSSNPIIKLINLIMGIVEFFLGIRRSGTMTELPNHIVIHTRTRILWFFTSYDGVLKIAKSRIAGVKVSKERSFIFFRSIVCALYAAGVTEPTTYGVKENYDRIKERTDTWITT